jgi:hypothetical protein
MRAQNFAEENNYEKAYQKIDDGIDLIQSYSQEDKKGAKLSIQRLRANKLEMEGDEALENQNLDAAETKYGQAIYNYSEINRNEERKYLLKRNKLISASIAEQKGDFEAAKYAHQDIADASHKDSFERFNRQRANICQAKQLIIEDSLEKIPELLDDIEDYFGLPGLEAKHLNLLVDVYNSYKNGNLQDTGAILNRLDSLSNISDQADEFPFDYGHDIRPALVNILAAQRLKKVGVDSRLLEKLVNVSLQAVLSPNESKLEIDQWGIGDVGLQNRWRLRFPTHIVNRYEELNSKATVGDDMIGDGNYSDEAMGLLRLLEQSLEFAGDYFAYKSYGTEWQYKFTDNKDGRLTMGALRSFLNDEVMEERLWNDDVCELLDKEIIGESDVMELRNQFGHDRKPTITKEEYEAIDERINNIFSMIEREIPVMGEVVGQHRFGAYKVNVHWENATNWCYLNTDKDVELNEVYYLPTDFDIGEKVIDIDRSEIVPCSSDRALDNLMEYTSIS